MAAEKISVCVISYQAQDTILDTLNSILAQSYGAQHIELLIADDASTDNTVSIIKTWLAQHQQVFNHAQLLAHSVNQGVAKNINSVWKIATCDWIKSIAGDDMLHKDCLKHNMAFVSKNSEVAICFSKMERFYQTVGDHPNKKTLTNPKFFQLSATEQFKFLQVEPIIGAPSTFMKRKTLEKIGYADEYFKLIEDYPLYFKLTQAGVKLHFLDQLTVYYRVSNSISQSTSRLENLAFLKEIENIEKLLLIPSLEKQRVIYTLKIISLKMRRLIIFIFSNKRNVLSYFLYRLCKKIAPKYFFLEG
jgi:glycosyltransferase involved in cell wall biosynthesis